MEPSPEYTGKVMLPFRNGRGFPYKRDAAEVLYAMARGQNCELYFGNGTVEVYAYPLAYVHKQVWCLDCFRRLGRFLLVNMRKVKGRIYCKALLDNGEILTLTETGNRKLKDYMRKRGR
jgi:hypothetical protein